jgi:cytochrome c553
MPRPLLALFALFVCGAAQAATPPDTIAERVRACSACHGEQGRATQDGYFPRIAGKPAGYLYEQLVSFRDGRRRNTTMAYLVDLLSDDYLREIADHFASLDLPYPPPAPRPADAALLARGEALALRGDAARELPACARCHGAALLGAQPALPGLLGLPRDYLVAQLGAWKTGQRHARAPDCMKALADKLSDDDVSAVASWLASRPVPMPSKPATSVELPLPVSCGSGPK